MGAGDHDHGLADVLLGDAREQVGQGFLEDALFLDHVGVADAGFGDDFLEAGDVQGLDGALGVRNGVFEGRGLDRRGAGLGGLAGAGALLAVEDVALGHFRAADAHERQFDLVLDVFDVPGAAVGAALDEGGKDELGDALDLFRDARRGRLETFLGQEGLGDGFDDLLALEAYDRAVTTFDLVLRGIETRRNRADRIHRAHRLLLHQCHAHLLFSPLPACPDFPFVPLSAD